MDDFLFDYYKSGYLYKVKMPNHMFAISEFIYKRYQHKVFLTFKFYYEYNQFFVNLEKQMMKERSKIEYYIILLNKVIEATKLSFDLRYIFVSFLV